MFTTLRVALITLLTLLVAFAFDHGASACVYPYGC